MKKNFHKRLIDENVVFQIRNTGTSIINLLLESYTFYRSILKGSMKEHIPGSPEPAPRAPSSVSSVRSSIPARIENDFDGKRHKRFHSLLHFRESN